MEKNNINEQELIIQGNQASVLMPKLKRYIDAQIAALSGSVASKAYVDAQIAALSGSVASKAYVDAQIAALAERDKDTLFINFSEVSPSERQTILFVDDGYDYMAVYTEAYIPEDDEFQPEGGFRRPIAQSIYDKYHESYPWLEENNVAKKVVDGYIVLVPTNVGEEEILPKDTPWLRLGYCAYSNEADVIEQHLGWIKSALGDDSEGEDLFSGYGFLTNRSIPIGADVSLSAGRNFVLKGWMLLKNS